MEWFALAGSFAHVGDGTVQELGELLLFLRGEVPNQLFLHGKDGTVHGLLEFPALGKDVNAFAAAIVFVGTQGNEVLLFQAGQKTRYGGMTQLEGFLNIPGAGWVLPQCQIAHDMPLGGSQLHGCQGIGNGPVGAGVQNPKQMTEGGIQDDHLQYR